MSDERLRDDWFERALEDEDGREADDGGELDRETASEEGGRSSSDEGSDADAAATSETSESVGSDLGAADEPFDLEAAIGNRDPNGEDAAGEDVIDDLDLENAGGGAFDLEDDAAALDPADVDGNAGGDSLFEEDFNEALADVDVPGGGSMGAGPAGFDDVDFGLGGAADTDFDEDFDSDLPRIDLGIDGLDGMIQGGVPERSLMVAMGSAGTGKTTFGLQFLAHGLAQGESAVFITLEESRERVLNSATEMGYPFEEYAEEGRLAVVDVDPIEMANSLASIRSELPALIEEFDASRLVLDSVSLLEMMYDDRAKRRNEIYDFTRSLKEAGVTAMLTSEASENNAYASRYGIVEYLTDAVFVLQYVRPDDFRETRLAIEIQKIRDANHSRETKPYEITGDGISVHQQANLF